MSAPTPSLANGKIRMNPPVFYFAASFILIFGLVVIINPESAGQWLLAAQNWAANTVGWYCQKVASQHIGDECLLVAHGFGQGLQAFFHLGVEQRP